MAEPVLAVVGIAKGFSGVRALRGVSFDVRAGEIHALIGENGAGKSTLMRILSGVYRADAGEIRVDGREVAIASPAAAFAQGIAMVYQDTQLVPELDGAANLFLGREPRAGPLLDRARMLRDGAALLATLGQSVDLRRPVRTLSRAQSQVLEIARALSRQARLLILDEPTSALTTAETDGLFALLRRLRAGSSAVVFISHRIPEVMALADRISVLKDGALVGTLNASEATPARLVAMMVGRDLALAYPARASAPGVAVLAASGRVANGPQVSVVLRAGEILGLGGVQGSGQQEMARALFGLLPFAGRIELDGRIVAISGPRAAIAAAIAYVPADRRGEGLFLPHAIRENISLPHLRRWSRAGVIDAARERRTVAEQIARLRVRTPSMAQPVGLLSGGNQQKVVFARWLLAAPRAYLFDEPTQGVDVETKLELYRMIRALADGGAAVLVVSSDVLELIGLSDRIAVFSRGAIAAEFPAAEATEARVIGASVVTEHAADGIATARAAAPLSGWTIWRRRYGPALVLAALILVIGAAAASQSRYFLTARTMASLQLDTAPLALAALGQLGVILVGGIDLSIGPLVSLTTCIASFLIVDPGAGNWLGIAACLAAGLAAGLANAMLVQALRIPDLIATLSSYSVVLGLALIVRPAPGGSVAGGFSDFLTQRAGALSPVFLAVVALFAAVELLLLRGRLGARLYAAGSSAEAAQAAGLRVGRIRGLAYVASGLASALAGLLLAARIGSGDPQAGASFTLTSITAVAVGGASVLGGSGTAVGTLLGAVLVILLQNALNLVHVTAYWQYICTGVLTLAAVAAFSWRRRA